MQNHVIDPTFFYDAIELFAFNYNWYVVKDYEIDDMGRRITKFDSQIIRGSLQPRTSSLNLNLSGNSTELKYDFYCKSLYRINIGDFIFYKNRFLHVDGVSDYDEWGVRSASLTMVNLSDYKDLEEYVKYLEGDIIV